MWMSLCMYHDIIYIYILHDVRYIIHVVILFVMET